MTLAVGAHLLNARQYSWAVMKMKIQIQRLSVSFIPKAINIAS